MYEVMTLSVVGCQPEKDTQIPVIEATKHIERTFLISDYYWSYFLYKAMLQSSQGALVVFWSYSPFVESFLFWVIPISPWLCL